MLKRIMQWVMLFIASMLPEKRERQVKLPPFVITNTGKNPIFYRLEESDRQKRIIDKLKAQMAQGSKLWRPRNRRSS